MGRVHHCAACSVPATASLQQQQQQQRASSQVHQSSVARCCRTAGPLCWSSSSLHRVRPNSDSPPGARPACLLPHPHSPHRFCCRRPGAFLSWHRHSSTSKLGPPLAENWLIPRDCLLCRDAFCKSNLQSNLCNIMFLHKLCKLNCC